MAISPKDTYNANQIDASDPTNYPEGKAKNISAIGNTDGTPYEEKIVNDIFGFQQNLLQATGQTPDGNPETAQASQYVEACRRLSSIQTVVFNTPGPFTWKIPEWLTPAHKIKISICGGGGGGGGSYLTTNTSVIYGNGNPSVVGAGGGGGGSGNYKEIVLTGTILQERLAFSIAGTVGAGGAGGASFIETNPTAGSVAQGGADGGQTTAGTTRPLSTDPPSVSFQADGGKGGMYSFAGTEPGTLIPLNAVPNWFKINPGWGGDGFNGGGSARRPRGPNGFINFDLAPEKDWNPNTASTTQPNINFDTAFRGRAIPNEHQTGFDGQTIFIEPTDLINDPILDSGNGGFDLRGLIDTGRIILNRSGSTPEFSGPIILSQNRSTNFFGGGGGGGA